MAIDIAGKIKGIKTHWKEPPQGKYVSYKEFAAYSVGGMGVNTINGLFSTYVPVTASSVLLGSVYGLRPTHIVYLAVIINIISLIKTPFISMLLDNTKSKHGKFRPYLLYMGFPTVAFLIAMAFLPLDADYNVKLILIGTTYTFLLFFQSFYLLAYTSIAQVITPDGEERTAIMTVSSVVGNFGPSVLNFLFPTLAAMLWGGQTDITSYRFLFPIFSIFGVFLGLWVFFGTKERVIVPKSYVQKVKFKDGLKQVSKNKYFWQLYSYQFFGTIKVGIYSITGWYFIYVLRDETYWGLIISILNTGHLPGMLLAPLLAKKLGKRRALIIFNILHGTFALFMMFAMNNTILFFVFMYLSILTIGMDAIITQSMTADVFDYQQWKTGVRLEGFITQFGGMLVAGVTALLNLIVPFFYEFFGLMNDYTVLYDPAVRTPVFNVLIITTFASSIVCVIPLLFYNLTEKKQKQYIKDLKARAAEENAEAEMPGE